MKYGLKVTSYAFEKPSAASHDNVTFADGWAVYIYTVCEIWQAAADDRTDREDIL
mgnify:CR=1 FL=1